MAELVTRNFWWSGITREMKQYVEGCNAYQCNYNKTAGELEDLQQQNILFLFHFYLLCNSLKCAGYYDSKGVYEIIQVDKYQ